MKKLSKKEWVAVAVAIIFVGYTLFGANIMRLFQKNNVNTNNNAAAVNTTQTQGGVTITDVAVGQGPEVRPGDTVSIHYILALSNGTVVQNSKDFGQPFTFTLGQNQVIPGMEQGIAGMRVGGVRTITIPPELAYGPQAVGPIPANSTLVFTVELVDATATPPQAAPAQ